MNVNRNWHFVIKPLYSFIMLLGIGICFTAAYWQYQKSIFYQAPANQVLHMQGTFLNEYNHFLDNQTFNGQAGYALITPFDYEGHIFLVNRGFVGYKNRDALPQVDAVTGLVTIEGVIKQHHKPLLLNDSLQDPVNTRIQFIDEKYFSSLLNQNVNDEIFVQQSGPGLLQSFPETKPYLSYHRHQGYAVQWLLLAICGVIIWIIASIKRGEKHA